MQTHNIDSILTQRGERYGVFADHAKISQGFKDVARRAPGWNALQADQREAIEMTLHKIARILNGDPDYDDNWVDSAGYMKLVADRLTSGGK